MEALNLTGRKGVVVGIANEHSLAWSAAQHFHEAGADLAITYLNDKLSHSSSRSRSNYRYLSSYHAMFRNPDSSKQYFRQSSSFGDVSTLCFTRLPGHAKRICMAD